MKTMKDDVEALIDKAANQPMAGPLVHDLASALTTLRDRLAAAERGQEEAIAQMFKTARELGEAQGKLAASELPGVIDGWRERALDAERERDEAKELALASYDNELRATDAAKSAESRVIRLTEALEKAREGLLVFEDAYQHAKLLGDSYKAARKALAAIDAALKGKG
jgi:hypothetical protein